MQNTKSSKHIVLKATIKNTIVAFVYVSIIVGIIEIFFGSKISMAISLINTISIEKGEKNIQEAQTNQEENINQEVKINSEKKMLEEYPEYGTQYGRLIIKDLEVDLPLYFGDTLSILRNGVGHSSGSYFPGEGGAIICMAHNTKGFLRRLPEIQIGTKIQINTVYGEYTYTVYETKIVPGTETSAVPVQHDEEILMLYTCYPVNSIGHAKNRFITYSKLDK